MAKVRGKDGKGIFPASVDFTTDLHSMGQWIQDGERTIFETVLSVSKPAVGAVFRRTRTNLDGINYIAGKRIDEVNRMAELGTPDGPCGRGVPNIRIELDRLDEYTLRQLIFFFEKACGISGYMLGVKSFPTSPEWKPIRRTCSDSLRNRGYTE